MPNLIPSVETQLMFTEITQNNYKISFDEWYTERRLKSDFLVQHDSGSAQQVNSPIYLISAHQTKDILSAHDEKNKFAIFNNLDLRKYYVEIDSLQYPRDSVLVNYGENDYIEQYKDLNLFFKEYIEEPKLNPFISYPDMKTKYPIELCDIKYQPDHITLKSIQLFQEYGTDLDKARLFLILNICREI